jgi:hypothetical protein
MRQVDLDVHVQLQLQVRVNVLLIPSPFRDVKLVWIKAKGCVSRIMYVVARVNDLDLIMRDVEVVIVLLSFSQGWIT